LTPDDPDVDASLKKGELKFSLEGQKPRDSWVLVRTRLGRSDKPQWPPIKCRDRCASTQAKKQNAQSPGAPAFLETPER
jgi:hypothetical protein